MEGNKILDCTQFFITDLSFVLCEGDKNNRAQATVGDRDPWD